MTTLTAYFLSPLFFTLNFLTSIFRTDIFCHSIVPHWSSFAVSPNKTTAARPIAVIVNNGTNIWCTAHKPQHPKYLYNIKPTSKSVVSKPMIAELPKVSNYLSANILQKGQNFEAEQVMDSSK